MPPETREKFNADKLDAMPEEGQVAAVCGSTDAAPGEGTCPEAVVDILIAAPPETAPVVILDAVSNDASVPTEDLKIVQITDAQDRAEEGETTAATRRLLTMTADDDATLFVIRYDGSKDQTDAYSQRLD